MKFVIGVVTLITVASAAFAAPPKRHAAAKAPAKAAVSTASKAAPATPAPWKPLPFVEAGSALPANYTGMDAWETFKFLQGLSAKTKKDEFETTAQYEARIADVAALMGALDPKMQYAFKMEPDVAYDADTQSYEIGNKYGGECSQKDYLSKGTVQLCKVHRHFDDAPDYEGQNAYGAKATIRRIRGTYVSIAIDRTQLPKNIFVKEQYLDNYKVSHRLPIELSQASTMRGQKIAMLVVGYITGPQLVTGRGVYKTATITEPTEMAISEYGIPFKPTEFLFYVVETGKILERVPVE